MTATTLLLVRHGATPWTHERRLQGRTDIDLSARGRADVEALAPLVAEWQPAGVVSSPLRRARTTTELLCRGAGIDAPIVVDDGWCEHGLGEWEGRTGAEIGPDYARWRAGQLVPPGGETTAQTRDRVRAALARATRLDGPVLVVTHGGTIRAVLAEALGLGPDRIEPVAAPSLTVLDLASSGGRLRRYNAQR